MPLRSLRWIRPSAGASWAGADDATAAVAVAAAVVFMNTRRFISYGAVITLPLELDDSRLVASRHSRSVSEYFSMCALALGLRGVLGRGGRGAAFGAHYPLGMTATL